MARKRKSEATGLDEVDRTLYSTFCGAANSLSQLYTQAMNQQKISFQAGERHALEKLYQWIVRKHEEGSRVTVADIVAHMQTEMDYSGEDTLVPPRPPFQNQHHQTTMNSHPVIQTPSSLFAQPTVGIAPRSGQTDQPKNSVFSNALSSPVRRSLQPYHLANGSEFYANDTLPTGNPGVRNHDSNQNRESNSTSSNDSSMDIHTDSPPHGSY
ncbi:hypothetical protein Cni_G07873 [Canna indica]|uniref:Holocarboxylase synthetase n=1 Tax=Canna indica TaxID=4628 RepID=A0AAQ3K2V3_9LILI|nr:hypothetical protein Cni_G07873 [Canna indica]